MSMLATKNYWNLILDNLKNKVQSSHYNAWFSQLDFVRTKKIGTEIVLKTPSKFSQNYLETKYKKELLDSVNKYYPRVAQISFEIGETKTKKQYKKKKDNPDQNTLLNEDNGKINKSKKSLLDKISTGKSLVNHKLPRQNLNNLNPKYTFQNFVVTSNNELTSTVSKLISTNPGQQYNPVFIHSNVGLGKTHILHAIGHQTLELFPNYNIKYVTSESFLNHYITSIRNKDLKNFNEFYRNVDLLLVDDIQFISGKEGTQEAFFHIFNILHQNSKQIVVTSDKHPKSMIGVENRLVSRFEWGLVVDISSPNLEDRIAVITQKVKQIQLNLSDKQIHKIASTIKTNYRDMEGVLNRIQAVTRLLPHKTFDEQSLDQILQLNTAPNSVIRIDVENSKSLNLENVIARVCQVMSVTEEKVKGKNREKSVSLARQICIYLCKNDLNYSVSLLSKIFGRNHSTIIHSIDKIDQKNGKDQEVTRCINRIRQNYTSII